MNQNNEQTEQAQRSARMVPAVMLIPLVMIIAVLAFVCGMLYVRSQGSTEQAAEDSVYAVQTEPAPVTETEPPATASETAAATSTTPETTAVATTTEAPPKPSASITSARIVGEYNDRGAGYMYRLDVTGEFDYWIAQVAEEYPPGEFSRYPVNSREMTPDYPYLTGGSSIISLSAVVTPYDANGNAGEPYSVVWNKNTDIEHVEMKDTAESLAVYSTEKYGVINNHGHTVPGYQSSYILDGGAPAKVRSDLGHNWHIVSYRYCYWNGSTMYELYDAWDGDYYGWVEEWFIDWD